LGGDGHSDNATHAERFSDRRGGRFPLGRENDLRNA
jgi:hypothetical protein